MGADVRRRDPSLDRCVARGAARSRRERSLLELPLPVWRAHAHAVADRTHRSLSNGLCKSYDFDAINARMAPFIASGFERLCDSPCAKSCRRRPRGQTSVYGTASTRESASTLTDVSRLREECYDPAGFAHVPARVSRASSCLQASLRPRFRSRSRGAVAILLRDELARRRPHVHPEHGRGAAADRESVVGGRARCEHHGESDRSRTHRSDPTRLHLHVLHPDRVSRRGRAHHEFLRHLDSRTAHRRRDDRELSRLSHAVSGDARRSRGRNRSRRCTRPIFRSHRSPCPV